MLLSNLTRSFQGASLFMSSDTSRKDLEGYNLLRLISWFLKHPAKVSSENPVVDEKEEMSRPIKKVLDDEDGGGSDGSGGSGVVDVWEHVAGILANVTRIGVGRTFILDWTRGLLKPLVQELYSKSVTRRRGIARMLRNVCNEFAQHKRLLDVELDGGLDLVHVALLSLSNGATMALELNDDERDVTRPELYAQKQVGDVDVVVRKKLCEMLVVLTRSHYGRELMRLRFVSVVVVLQFDLSVQSLPLFGS